ncbi:MAG: ABC transporter substrate binding protein [Desulfocapsaceae bacterium]|nr:ABC transporter substrate binding protein [Desulfocapsaceae bacterium]
MKDIGQGVEDVLLADENSYSLHIENMDSKEFHSEIYFAAFKDYLTAKYAETDIHLILSSDNNAYDFLRKHRDQLFPGVPVVFCGVNNFDESQIADMSGITGATEVFSADTTVKLARQLIPELKRVYIVNDYLNTGRFWESDIRKQLVNLEKRISFEYNENLSFEELLDYVAALPADTAVLLGAYFSDRDDKFYTYEQVASRLSQASSVPVFSLVEFIIDEGMVGGQVISGYYQGRAMAELAVKILQGEDIHKIPVLKEGSNRAIFNYEQLQRHGLKEHNLPQNVVIVNRPFSFYETYQEQIWIVAAFIAVLMTAILLLIINIARRKSAERSLRQSEKRFRQLADATWEALIIHDNGVLLEANEMFEHLSGYKLEEIQGTQVVPLFFPEEYQKQVRRRFATSDPNMYEAIARDRSGRVFPIEVRVRYMEYEGRQVRVAALRDLTERQQMEEQLTQSRKLEAMGTLAGGIAHDFNNILSAIIGYAEILLLTKKNDADTSEKLQQILNAGNRAKHLVQQILTFARKTEEQLETVQLSEVVREVVELIRASFPSSVKIKELVSTDGCVLGDLTKMHQLVMNLCTNAGKAMPDGGLLEVSLVEAVLEDDDVAAHPGLSPGRFLRLTVSDTGGGIAPDHISKIFDPFFTTDENQKGTGLGLAVVHGIVKECGGIIEVESEEGDGTSFIIHLPQADCLQSDTDAPAQTLPSGHETIMIIDDEEDLIQIGVEALSSLGYHVQGFASSRKAVKCFVADPERFDLVITDLTMPEISGEAVARKLLALRNDLPIIICSGYSETFHEDDAKRLGVKRYLVKPVAAKDMAMQVREVLDEAQAKPA